MKYVLHIIAKLYIGGAEKVARDIGLYAPEGYENHYVVFGDEVCEYEAPLIARGCRVFHIPAPPDGYRQFIGNLRRLMGECDYTAVHAHTMFNAGLVMHTAKQMGVPVRVAHAHSALRDGEGIVKSAYEAAMRRLILSDATELIACGADAGKRLFGERAYNERARLILNGIDTAHFAFDAQKRERMRCSLGLEDCFVIGHVGHLTEVKNQRYLVELMPELLKRKENARLLLLGDGEDREMLERLVARLGLSGRVIMTGSVSNVGDYLSAMDVFAFPSLYEGMPLSIVEVQANGLPCVISDRVPRDVFITELLTALPLEDRTAWVDAICAARRGDSEKYAAVIENGGFGICRVVRKIYDVYEGGRI